MLSVNVVSQRDPRWANLKLGTSNVTIGGYGCVISCLDMISGIGDVGRTNEFMKAGGAYEQQNLTNWIKAAQALPNLKFIFRSWVYDNNQVKNWIYNRKFPVIVQVDAAPIGAPRSDHYIVYLGDQKCADPWTGKIRPTADFPDVKGYILYEQLTPMTLEQKVKKIIYSSDSDSQKVAQLQILLPK